MAAGLCAKCHASLYTVCVAARGRNVISFLNIRTPCIEKHQGDLQSAIEAHLCALKG
jgi:hypothetical protein